MCNNQSRFFTKCVSGARDLYKGNKVLDQPEHRCLPQKYIFISKFVPIVHSPNQFL